MKNIVCLISGRGSNLDAILRRARQEDWLQAIPARVAAVISSHGGAPGLDIARAAQLPTHVVDHRQVSRAAFEVALHDALAPYEPELIVLAGFMRVLSPEFVQRYAGRMINIHPSLLPAFPGLRTHAQALAAGVRVHGATVHYVSSAVDAGAIIAQSAVVVEPDDTEEALAARVLYREHDLLPAVVRWCCEERVRLVDGRVRLRELDTCQLARIT